MSETVYLSNVRLSFPKLIEALVNKDFPAAGKKFGCDLLMAPNHPDFQKVMTEVGKCAGEKWKEHAQNVLSMISQDKRLRCWGSGADRIRKDTFKVYEGYEGMVYLSASADEDKPPQIVDGAGNPIDNANTMQRTAAARKLYGGCYVNAAVRIWPQDNQFGRGMRCQLIAVQFLADGEPFGDAEPDVKGMFGAVPGAQQQPGAAPQWAQPAQAPVPPWQQPQPQLPPTGPTWAQQPPAYQPAPAPQWQPPVPQPPQPAPAPTWNQTPAQLPSWAQ